MASTSLAAAPGPSGTLTGVDPLMHEALLEARQYEHIRGMDVAYYEGFTVLREASGQDLSADVHHPLADAYGPYTAFRRELLKSKLLSEHARFQATHAYGRGNRFSLGSSGDLDAPVSACTAVALSSSSSPPTLTYAAWRRSLLARRFEARRSALEMEMFRRIADEKLQRAQAAEEAEREVAAAPQLGISAAPPPAAFVWRIKHHMEGVAEEAGTPWLELPRAGSVRGPRAAPPAVSSSRVTAVSFATTEADFFAVATEAGVVHICSWSLGTVWTTLSGHTGAVTGLEWSPAASPSGDVYLVTVSTDKSARVWAVRFPYVVQPPPLEAEDDESKSRQRAAARERRRSITRHDPVTGSPLRGSGSAVDASQRTLGPAEREAELERLRRQMEAESARARDADARARGPQLEGGHARCISAVETDYPLTHVALYPGNPALVVAAGVEDADLEAERALEALESGDGGAAGFEGGDGSPSTKLATLGNVGRATALLKRGLQQGLQGGVNVMKGGVNVVKAVGGATMGAIEAVPVMGGAVGALRTAAASAAAGMTSAITGSGARKERRGHIVVMNAAARRVIQTRRIVGSKVGMVDLAKKHSYITAMTFAPDGSAVYAADARGRLHSFAIEQDPATVQLTPLTEHTILFGEGSNKFTPHAAPVTSAAPAGVASSTSFSGSRYFDDDGGGAVDAESMAASPSPVAGAAASAVLPHLRSLVYRAADKAHRTPMLLGLDDTAHVRVLQLPVVKGPDLERSVLSAAAASTAKVAQRVAVGAVGVMTAGLAAPMSGTSTPQATELSYVHYLAGLPTGSVAALERAASAADSTLNSSTSIGRGGSTLGSGSAGWSSGPHIISPLSHCSLATSRLTDVLFVGNAAGEVFVLDPYGGADKPKVGGRAVGPGNLLVGGALAAAGSGVSSHQVIAKLVGHVRPVTNLAVNSDEQALVSVDESGQLVVWERVSLTQVETEGSALGYAGSPIVGGVDTSGLTVGRDGHLSVSSAPGSRITQLLHQQMNQGSLGRAAAAQMRTALGLSASTSPRAGFSGGGSVGATGMQSPLRAGADASGVPRHPPTHGAGSGSIGRSALRNAVGSKDGAAATGGGAADAARSRQLPASWRMGGGGR